MKKTPAPPLRSPDADEDSVSTDSKAGTDKKPARRLHDIKVRAALLVVTFAALCFLFLSPPVRLTEDLEAYKKSVKDAWEECKNNKQDWEQCKKDRQGKSRITLDASTVDYLKVEHQKVNDEIRLRTEAQDSWFHYKFILTGGMVALLLGQIGLGEFGLDVRARSAASKPRRWMKNIFSSESAYLILALSCVVSLTIDMHIRSQSAANQRLGLWVSNFVEPSLVAPPDMDMGFLPWEQLLRAPTTGLWTDSLYRIAYGLHLHYMTIFIYLLYSWQLQGVCLEYEGCEKNHGQRMAVAVSYVFVLLSAFAFTFVSHMIPPTAEISLFHSGKFVDGVVGTLYYLIPLPILAALHLPYLWLVRTRPRQTTAHSH